MFDPSKFAPDAILTSHSRAVTPEGLIWSEVATDFNIKSSRITLKSKRSDHVRLEDTVSEPGSKTPRTKFRIGPDLTFALEFHRLAEPVTVSEEADVAALDTPFDPRLDAVTNVTTKLQLGKEKKVADILFNSGLYLPGNTSALTSGATGSAWDEYASVNSNPFIQLQTALEQVKVSCMKMPNTMTIGWKAMNALRYHPVIRAQFNQHMVPTIQAITEMLSGILGIPKILVGRGQYDPSNRGQADATSFSDLWGNSVSIYYKEDTPSLNSQTFIGHFHQDKFSMAADAFTEEDEMQEVVRVVDRYKFGVVDQGAGYLFTNVVS